MWRGLASLFSIPVLNVIGDKSEIKNYEHIRLFGVYQGSGPDAVMLGAYVGTIFHDAIADWDILAEKGICVLVLGAFEVAHEDK